MRKEYYLFFVFVLAAAITTGSALGLLGNIKYIQSNPPDIVADETEVNSSDPTMIAQQNINSTNALPARSETNEVIQGNEKTVLISPEEQFEVTHMLSSIDSSKSDDYNQRISKFQKQNSLSVTGVLDAKTLGILIQQAKLQKAYQRLNP